MAHAHGKAEAAMGVALKAQEESRLARVTAKQFSPSVHRCKNGWCTAAMATSRAHISVCGTRLVRARTSDPPRQLTHDAAWHARGSSAERNLEGDQ